MASNMVIAWNITRFCINCCERWPVMSLPCAMPTTPLISTNYVASAPITIRMMRTTFMEVLYACGSE
jgi:hypothetical protein